jgi:hypothetical protein
MKQFLVTQMKRPFVLLALVVGVTAALTIPMAVAGSPHQVHSCTVTVSSTSDTLNNQLNISCKEAGLGDESQITVHVQATAECINGGGNHPKAVNKQTFSQDSNQPVQNGKADYTITLTASFSPSCSPPMTIEWVDISAVDTTNNIQLVSVPGPLP